MHGDKHVFYITEKGILSEYFFVVLLSVEMKINNMTAAMNKLKRKSDATVNKLGLLTGTINKLEQQNNATLLHAVEELRQKDNKCKFQVRLYMPKIILLEIERIF